MRPGSIGKAYAIQGLLNFLATIFAVAVLFGSTKDLPFSSAIFIVCPILYLISFLSIIGLKEVKSRTEVNGEEVVLESASFISTINLQLRLIFQFSWADSVYNVAYFGNFVSEMGYLLSFVYINAWTSQFFIG